MHVARGRSGKVAVATGACATDLGWRLGFAHLLQSVSQLLQGLLPSLAVAEHAFDALRMQLLQHSRVVQPDPDHLRLSAPLEKSSQAGRLWKAILAKLSEQLQATNPFMSAACLLAPLFAPLPLLCPAHYPCFYISPCTALASPSCLAARGSASKLSGSVRSMTAVRGAARLGTYRPLRSAPAGNTGAACGEAASARMAAA